MEIKTKLSIGDRIFFMNENKVKESNISSITVIRYKSGSQIEKYGLDAEIKNDFTDKELFTSKESLLNSL